MPRRAVSLLLALAGLLPAEDATLITTHLPAAPRIEVPRAQLAPAIDADPEDAAWAAAAVVPRLALVGPGVEAATTVLLLWDETALYLRFVATDDGLHQPFGQTRDAKHYQGDVAEVFLDPVGDARQYYEIQVTPTGGVFDLNLLLTGEPLSHPDGRLAGQGRRDWWSVPEWDCPDLRHAGRVLEDEFGATSGWIVDLAIPAAVVMRRLPRKTIAPMTMRANLARYDWPTGADPAAGDQQLSTLYWAPVARGNPHVSPLAMGELVLVERDAEITPAP